MAEKDFGVGASKGEIAERLKMAVKMAGGNKAVADKAGVPLKSLGNYLSGVAEMKASVLVVLARACEVSLDWLATGVPPVHTRERLEAFGDAVGEPLKGDGEGKVITRSAAELGDEFVLVPRLDVRAAAGAGSVIHSEQVVDYLAFKADWVRTTLRLSPASLVLIRAFGDSMEPGISDGDLLLVNTAVPRVTDNAIYVLSVDGDLIVKRVQRHLDGSLTVRSDNARYEPEDVPAGMAAQLRIVGQVVWHGHTVR